MKFIPLLFLFCTSCVSFVRELHNGPYPLAHESNATTLGIKASYAGYGLELGLIRFHQMYLPVSTNKLWIPPFDSTFTLGQSWTDTSVKESVVTGYEGSPPPARFQRLFSPKEGQ